MVARSIAVLSWITLFAMYDAHAAVIVVSGAGGGDHTSLTAAVAASADGDTILVRDGQYNEPGPVVIDGKSLTIIADNLFQNMIRPGIVVKNVGLGKRLSLVNLTVVGAPSTDVVEAGSALILRDNAGHVRVQHSWLLGGGGATNSHPHGAAAVRSSMSAANAIVECSISGGDGRFSNTLAEVTGNGGPGIEVSGGVSLVHQSYVTGGAGGGNIIGAWPDGGIGAPGISHSGGTLWLAATSISGGAGGTAHNGGDGGAGLVLGPTGPVWLLAGSFAFGGSGGFSDAGPDGSSGASILDPAGILQDFGGVAHGFSVTSPCREGASGWLTFNGSAGESKFLFIGSEPTLIPFANYQGAFMISPPTLIGPFDLGTPGSGVVPFIGPTLPAGIDVIHVHIQAAYVGASGVTLGPSNILTILDSSL